MNWKEEFDKQFLGNSNLDLLKNTNAGKVRDFISTEIIEKLIDDAWELNNQSHISGDNADQQLKDKWL